MKSGDPRLTVSIARFLAGAAVLYAAALALCLLFLGPTRELDRIRYSTAVYDRNGALLRLTLSPDEKYRMRADAAALPPRFLEALFLKEDRCFYAHPGVNPAALARAFWHSMVRGDYRAGGSTITMQLARLVYRLDTDSAAGKLGQIIRALALETVYPKSRILEAYCSLVPCGGNVEGFPAASLIYFRKPMDCLSLSESLFLCSLPQRPSPGPGGTSSRSVRDARDLLYGAWVSRHPADGALRVQFDMQETFSSLLPFEAPHAVDSLLKEHAGEPRILSTIDLRLQHTVERMVAGYTEANSDMGIHNACALLVRRRGMEVLAEVGSADFHDDSISGQVNGTEARRSPGSTLKPFLYALAMEQSVIHPMTMLKDAPIHFSGYDPDNFDDDFEGPIKAKDALILSRNVPAVHLSQLVKNPDLYDLLGLCGVERLRGRSDYGLSLILGTAELTMKELAVMYGMLANRGELAPLRETVSGRGAAGIAPPVRTLLTPQAAFLTRRILEEKPRIDGLDAADLRQPSNPVAWKTGTSIGFRDAWSIGIFDSFLLCVWVGNFDGSGNPAFVGLRSAAPLMFGIIDAVRTGGLEKDYAGEADDGQPPGIITTKVCSVSGKIPNRFCPSLVDTWFIPGVSPIDVCDIHQEVFLDVKTGLRKSRPAEGKTRTVVYEIWPSDLLSLFRKAGLPRRQPPPFAEDEDLTARSEAGESPQIVSPLPKGEYAVGFGAGSGDEIPLIAVVPSDSTKIFWFLDESYLGQSPRGNAFFWKPVPGSHVLRATDEHGRSASCRFTVVPRS